ncbi:dual specificity phosphatase 22 [Brachionus plicatilis]|uniref:Dual specificity protein phosphatase 15 n=1 Tax=Brachionus plicatilis TaxID=10195 RepID=A0A3M7SRG8_BRAPC|nr:dual specificity phosphatase 22 [Brachionus plicatilis]
MGNGMNKILPGLYIGSIRDSTDIKNIEQNNITHILSIHNEAKPGKIENVNYLCFEASDLASEDLGRFFAESIDFVHSARINNGNVLVHCLAGVSRSATIVISYVMVVTCLPWYDSMNAVRAARSQVNPNFGFQRQLQNFEFTNIKTLRENLYLKYGEYNNKDDLELCKTLLEKYHKDENNLENNSNNQQQINRTLKTYPLAFNSYNLDKVKVKNNIQKTKEMRRNVTKKAEEKKDEKKAQEEKDKVFEKIFDQN